MLEAGIGDEQENRKGGGMMTRTEKEKMLAGELYNAGAPELQAEMAITYKWLARYNAALGASASDLTGRPPWGNTDCTARNCGRAFPPQFGTTRSHPKLLLRRSQ